MFNFAVVTVVVAVVVGYAVGPHVGLFLPVLVAVKAKRSLMVNSVLNLTLLVNRLLTNMS